MPYTVQWINQFSQLGETSVDALVTDTDKVLPDQRMSLIFKYPIVDVAFLDSKVQAVIDLAIFSLPPSGGSA